MDKKRAKMPPTQRAKQFAPFDAVVGLRPALKEKEKIRIARKELSDDAKEEINIALKQLKAGQIATVVWYDSLEQNYIKTTGKIIKINATDKNLEIENLFILFEDLYTITLE